MKPIHSATREEQSSEEEEEEKPEKLRAAAVPVKAVRTERGSDELQGMKKTGREG